MAGGPESRALPPLLSFKVKFMDARVHDKIKAPAGMTDGRR